MENSLTVRQWLQSEAILEFVTPVYRFCLVRTGDFTQAQEVAWVAFRQVMRDSWSVGVDRKDALRMLFSVVIHLTGQRRYRSGQGEAKQTEIPLSQDELFRIAQVKELSAEWKRLSFRQFDILSLYYFGGAPEEEISIITGKRPARVCAVVDQLADQASILCDLAQTIPIPESLTEQIRQFANDWADLDLSRGRTFKLHWLNIAYLGRSVSTGLIRFLPVLVALIFAGVMAILFIYRPPLGSQSSSTPTPAIITAPAILESGLLVPPDHGVCRSWDRRVETGLGRRTILIAVKAVDRLPLGDSPVGGTGCEISFPAMDDSVPATSGQMDLLEKLLLDGGFSTVYRVDAFAPLDFLDDVEGIYRIYRKADLIAVLSLVSNLSTQVTNLDNHGPAGSLTYAYQLMLVENTVQPVIDAFFSQWKTGHGQITSELSNSLQGVIPDITTLDQLVGIQRRPGVKFNFNWQLLENSGTKLRLKVDLTETNPLGIPAQSHAPIGVILMRHDDVWKITEISPGLAFAPTSDSLVLADSKGQIFSQSLKDGSKTVLSIEAAYKPDTAHTLAVSPDGHWGVLWQGTGQNWLLSLDGGPSRQLPNTIRHMIWSPDGRQLLLAMGREGEQLMIWEPGNQPIRPYIQLPGGVQEMSWSPDGQWIAVVYQTPTILGENGLVNDWESHISIGLISTRSKVFSQVINFPTSFPGYVRQNLTWSADGAEIWYLPAQLGIRISDLSIHALISQPTIDNQPRQYYFGPLNNIIPAYHDTATVSPNQQWRAITYPSTVGDLKYLAVQPANSPGKNVWNTSGGMIAQSQWTEEGDNLIVSTRKSGSGRVLRVDPATGENEVVAEGVYFLGVKSALKPANQLTIAQSPTSTIPTIFDNNGRKIYHNDLGLSFEYPSFWNIWEMGDGGSGLHVILSNVNFGDSFGQAALQDDQVWLDIDLIPWMAGVDEQAEWIKRIQETNVADKLYYRVPLGRYTAFRLTHSPYHLYQSWIVLSDHGMLWIQLYPNSPDTSLGIMKVIQSIQF